MIQRLSASNGYVLGVRADGSVLAWGNGMVGGTGSAVAGTVARQVGGVAGAAGAYASAGQSLVVGADGSLTGWGNNIKGALGVTYTGSNTVVADATKITQVSGVVQAKSCGGATFALKDDGTVWMVPAVRTNIGVVSAAQISGLAGVQQLVAIDAQNGASCNLLVLDASGAAWHVAANEGDYNGTSKTYTWTTTVTRDIVAPANLKQLACGRAVLYTGTGGGHCLALLADGTLWAWGDNEGGQLGVGDRVDRTAPVQVATTTGVKKMFTSSFYSFLLMEDGLVYAWGGASLNNPLLGGRTGADNTVVSDAWVPGLVPSISGVDSLALDEVGVPEHVTALKTDGTVWTWGSNVKGVFADGLSGTFSATPVQATGIRLN